MMTKFKVGDKIICDSYMHGGKEEVLTIDEITEDGYVTTAGGRGIPSRMYRKQFTLIIGGKI